MKSLLQETCCHCYDHFAVSHTLDVLQISEPNDITKAGCFTAALESSMVPLDSSIKIDFFRSQSAGPQDEWCAQLQKP